MANYNEPLEKLPIDRYSQRCYDTLKDQVGTYSVYDVASGPFYDLAFFDLNLALSHRCAPLRSLVVVRC